MNKKSDPVPKKPRADSQMSGLAGEFFVAAELLKRDLQTSVTFGNAKAIDILAHNSTKNLTFTVQVKAMRTKNFFPLSRKAINVNHIYVFVILNKPGIAVDYFIVRGLELATKSEGFGRFLDDVKMPGVRYKDLEPYRNNWQVFDG